MKMTELMTTAEACQQLRITRGTLYKLLHEGRLKSYRIGRDWRISPDDLITYMRTQAEDRR